MAARKPNRSLKELKHSSTKALTPKPPPFLLTQLLLTAVTGHSVSKSLWRLDSSLHAVLWMTSRDWPSMFDIAATRNPSYFVLHIRVLPSCDLDEGPFSALFPPICHQARAEKSA